MMIAGSTLTRVATPTTAKKSPPSEGIFGVPQTGVPARISICQGISTFFCENAAGANIRSDSRIQRAGVGRPGPNFRSVYPIWKISATSSDLHMALKIP